MAAPKIDEIVEQSRQDHESFIASTGAGSTAAGPSRSGFSRQTQSEEPSYLRKHALKQEVASLDAEIADIHKNIKQLEEQCKLRARDKEELLKELRVLDTRASRPWADGGGREKGRVCGGTIDYSADFDWSPELRKKMKKVFGIDEFRLCQKGVCNANMDGRDVVCVMPTGGGKSLTYQLPALLTPGVTLVVSPLISLMTDQCLHLKEARVEVVMLTKATSKSDSDDCYRRLATQAVHKGAYGPNDPKEIKLVYVTPERIAKSKMFMSMLQKLYTGRKLARIVIDEAHCVSSVGHDFRPDYQKLHVFKQYFPDTPIMGLSATCPPVVLQDLIKTLKLKPAVDGKCANGDGTVYFTAPLYRKNLHYSVVPKSSSKSEAIQAMADYILEHHPNDSGIVYCLSKADAENVKDGLEKSSGGRILTGVYHADRSDREKENLHKQWRKGAVKVVCATIAFGLGIDKGDVRFVLHHSLSKSMDGFYQESGRAGRDGKDADCILYYRAQDATRLSALVSSEVEGRKKLFDMLRFAQELKVCRKVHFAKYFSVSSHVAVSSWSTNDKAALEPCGHCDNCTRPPEHVDHKDVTLEAWQLLKVAHEVCGQGGNIPLTKLVDLARGKGGGAFTGGGGRRGKTKEVTSLDLAALAGGKVGLSKDDTETLVVHLILLDYLTEKFITTSYTVNVYVKPGTNAIRLSRFTRENLGNGAAPTIRCSFRKAAQRRRSRGKGETTAPLKAQRKLSDGFMVKGSGMKRKRGPRSEDEDDEHDGFIVSDDEDINDYAMLPRQLEMEPSDFDSDELEGEQGWHSITQAPRPPHKKKKSHDKTVSDIEVLEVSSG